MENSNVENVSPVEKPKRQISEKQKEALEKARFQRKLKSLEKKKDGEIFNFSSNYLIATGVLGFGALVGYYYLKQQKNSEEWQRTLEEKLMDLKNSMPSLPKTLIQKEILMQPEKPPQVIEREIIREVEKKPVEISQEELKKQSYFSNAKVI